MRETEKDKQIACILATGITREELAEALWCAESDERIISELRELTLNMWRLMQEMHARHSTDIGVAPRMVKLHSRMKDLGVGVSE